MPVLSGEWGRVKPLIIRHHIGFYSKSHAAKVKKELQEEVLPYRTAMSHKLRLQHIKNPTLEERATLQMVTGFYAANHMMRRMKYLVEIERGKYSMTLDQLITSNKELTKTKRQLKALQEDMYKIRELAKEKE